MFDTIVLSHDEIIARAIDIRRNVTPEQVGRAFLASLSSRRLDWRSALGSLAAILHLPDHPFLPRRGSNTCAVCGESAGPSTVDLNVQNFERLKWGGVRHDSPLYAAYDLTWFAALPPPTPDREGVDLFTALLDRISHLGPGARPSDLERSLRGLLPSNASERRIAISILGLAGVVVPRNRPTFWGEYPFCVDREGPSGDNDWPYPVLWWRGRDGINRDALRHWFPDVS